MPSTSRATPPQFLPLWLMAGTLACIVFPEARGHHPLIGWLPFWLVLAPAASLLAGRFLNRWSAPPRRHRQARRRPLRQARRLRYVRRSQAA